MQLVAACWYGSQSIEFLAVSDHLDQRTVGFGETNFAVLQDFASVAQPCETLCPAVLSDPEFCIYLFSSVSPLQKRRFLLI